MDGLNEDGIFWVHGHDDDQLVGRLTFEAAAGARLSVVGAFEAAGKILENDDAKVRIDGLAGGKHVVLLDAFRTSRGFQAPGFHREVYRPSGLLLGADLSSEDRLLFEGCNVGLRYLAEWAGRTGLAMTVTDQDDGNWTAEAHLGVVPDEFSDFQGGTLSLTYWGSMNFDRLSRLVLEHGATFELRFEEAMSLSDVSRAAGALQDLVTIGVDAPSDIETLTLRHPAHAMQQRGRTVYERLEFMAQRSARADEDGPRQPNEMWFTLEQAGGIATVARWLSFAAELRPVVGLLLSPRYSQHIYTENRLQNVTTAAETLHRLRFSNELRPQVDFERDRESVRDLLPNEHKKWVYKALEYSNEPRLRQRLTDLAGSLPELSEAILGVKTGTWASVVATARNRLTHPRGMRQWEPGDLYHLADSVYVVTTLALLLQCGVPVEALAGVPNTPRASHLASELPAVVTRLAAIGD